MKEQILSEIQRIANENGGRAPGKSMFERETGIRESAWSGRYWARWSDAVVEAGLTANLVQAKVDDSVFFTRMVKCMRHFGKIPTAPEIRIYRQTNADAPNLSTLEKKYGSKATFLELLRAYAKGNEGFADVLAMLPEVSLGASPARLNTKEGYVYLIKSGAHYKIGMSSEIERRIKQIRVAQPEASDLVHTIRTDDPSGIEAYWHRRFADRRANGEWFRLTTHDVAAFKRRKFQ